MSAHVFSLNYDRDAAQQSVGTAGTSIRRAFWTLIATATLLRVSAALLFPGAYHPDETYQVFEQAHRYAFGYGIRPWEYDDGLRSTLLPTMFGLVFKVAYAILGTPEAMVACARLLLVALSLMPVAAIFQAGLRSSPTHAIVGGVVAATWSQLIFFSYRPLTEAVAADFLLTALALTSFRGADIERRVLTRIGLCLGFALMLRVHFAPAIAVVGSAALGLMGPVFMPRRLAQLATGAALPILVFGVADWMSWGTPFSSTYTAFRVNVIEGVAAEFGTEPSYAYLTIIVAKLGWTALPIALLLRYGAKRYALWLLAAAAILIPHSLIAHKEYRFVFICAPILAVAAAFASVDLLVRTGPRTTSGHPSSAGIIVLIVGWLAASSAVCAQSIDVWRLQESENAALAALHRDPALCGLMLDEVSFLEIGGYAALHRNVPMFQMRHRERPLASTAFNTILTRAPVQPLDGYRSIRCFASPASDNLCVLQRSGHCEPDPTLVPLTQMPRLGHPSLYRE